MPKNALILGYLGLIPFIGLPLSTFLDVLPVGQSLLYFVQYSVIILSFFGGIHWWDAIQNNNNGAQLFVAMIPSLIGWFALIFAQGAILLFVLSLSYIATLFYDKHTLQLEKQAIIKYTKMRMILTTVVVLSHTAYIFV